MALEAEIKVFNENIEEWLKHHSGKFVAIHRSDISGFFDDAEAALVSGLENWGNVPFLIRRVIREEPIAQIPALFLGLIHAGA